MTDKSRKTWRGLRAGGVAAALVLPLMAVLPMQGANAAGNAGYTTFDQNQGGCTHGSAINCNIYADKNDVYMNGGPTGGNGLANGSYYFAVLTPGSQNGGFVDGATGNLSDTTNGGTTGDAGGGDPVACRTFTVGSGVISNYSPGTSCTDPTGTGSPTYAVHGTGTDPQSNSVIQLSPYDDTDNPGGVYILAICQVGATSASQCKFDMFKIEAGASNSAQDLTVVKNATASFTRSCTWTVTKTVDGKSSVSYNITGSTKDLNYEVVYTKSCTDSDWQVNGNITVFNPNTGDASNVTLSDSITGGGTCLIDGQTTPGDYSVGTLAGGDSSTVNYSCSFSSNPGNGTNTATATWDQTLSDSSQTPTASASFDAKFKFGDPTTVTHRCVVVTDTNSSGNVTSGTAPAGETICDSRTYDYVLTVTVPHGCVAVNNTAAFTATDDSTYTDSASTSATVCRVPLRTGALTMGFWQNKNGQSIITKANQTNLQTYLKQFHPFSDAPSTGLGAYVSGIIKAATCSGPTTAPCNKMLRAQTLATALDVYFSAPTTDTTDCGAVACGGNKIGATGAIGAVSIDLTQVCHMIDGSGGTATCSGTYENVSAQFGNATCLTVLGMLQYQNTSDPAADAGANWYGNVKANQVLAKDAFDAINNQVAFGC